MIEERRRENSYVGKSNEKVRGNGKGRNQKNYMKGKPKEKTKEKKIQKMIKANNK